MVSNFEQTLAEAEAASTKLLLRDPTVIDFIDAGQISGERSLEDALVADIERFMLALGQGFLYAGRQRTLVVGDEEFRLDLLFYHHPSRRWVVIELKTERFRPEFVGKVNFYVNAIDKLIAGPEDRATVGFILCTDRNEAAAHMTLSGIATRSPVCSQRGGSKAMPTSLGVPQDEVAGHQRESLGQEGDDLLAPEDQVRRARVLAQVVVDPGPQPQRAGIADLVGVDV